MEEKTNDMKNTKVNNENKQSTQNPCTGQVISEPCKTERKEINGICLHKAEEFCEILRINPDKNELEGLAMLFQKYLRTSPNVSRWALMWVKQVADHTKNKEKILLTADLLTQDNIFAAMTKFECTGTGEKIAEVVGKLVYFAAIKNQGKEMLEKTIKQVMASEDSEEAAKIASYNVCFEQAKNTMSIIGWDFEDRHIDMFASLLQKFENEPRIAANLTIDLCAFAKIVESQWRFLETIARMDDETVVNCIMKFKEESKEDASKIAKGLIGIAGFTPDQKDVAAAVEKVAKAATSSEAAEMVEQMLEQMMNR